MRKKEERGLNRLAYNRLFKRVIAGHYELMPKIGQLALEVDSMDSRIFQPQPMGIRPELLTIDMGVNLIDAGGL